jgi:NAD(P)H-dependent FMN reductase
MPKIVIISASVRDNRASHRVALFFEKFIGGNNHASAEIVDLLKYNFPIFHERLAHQKNPAMDVLEFSEKVKQADGVIIVTPEYNGGYPASLKNVIDLLYPEWYKKPIGIATVSDGQFGGTQVITSLVFSLWKIRAWIIPAMFPVPKVNDSFKEDGTTDDAATLKRAGNFLKEMLWCITAKQQMEGR